MNIMRCFYVAGCFLSLVCFQGSLEAKKLVSQQVGLLNISLGALPQVTARLKLSRSHAHTFCALLEKENQASGATRMSKADIDQHIKKLLDPVRDFFAKITEHKDMILPLLVESLKDYPGPKLGKTLANESYIIAFFTESGNDVVDFFQKRIATQQDFDQVIHELKYFLDDLFDSFSPNVLQAYDKMMADIHAKKAAPSVKGAVSHVAA